MSRPIEVNQITDVFLHFNVGELLATFLGIGNANDALLEALESLCRANSAEGVNDDELRERFAFLLPLFENIRAEYRKEFGWELEVPEDARLLLCEADRSLDANDAVADAHAAQYLFSARIGRALGHVGLSIADIYYLPPPDFGRTSRRRAVVEAVYAEWNEKLKRKVFILP